MRRVVVTGLGTINPLGNTVETSWNSLINSKSGISKITKFEVDDYPCKIAGTIDDSKINDNIVSSRDQRKIDRFITLGLIAANEAIKDSGFVSVDESSFRYGVMVGSGIGGLDTIYRNSSILDNKGIRKISPFFIPSSLINLLSGHISIKYNLKGPNSSPVTACATGTHAIGDSFTIIKNNKADLMVCGGAEAAICPLGISGFSAARALCDTFNENPEYGSRPWDKDRSGFVMGEGAGVLVLEEYEHAKARGAKIYAELTGYGATSDGYDMVAPSGEGAVRCMQMAMATSKNKIDYINTHGTSTPVGDITELNAVKKTFGENIPKISSTKSLSGHPLGAASVHEAIYCLIMMKNNFITGSANINEIDEDAKKFPIVTKTEKGASLNTVMSNSFGFGGTNAALIFEKV